MDVAAAQVLWTSLKNAVDQIYNQNASQLSFEELYRNAYNMVLHKHGEILYEGISNTIREHLLRSVDVLSATHDKELLVVLVAAWVSHTTAFRMIKDILMYMDKTFVLPRKKLPVYMMALSLFRDTIVYHPSIRNRLRDILLDNIAQERLGCVIDRDLVKSALSMLVELSGEGVNVYEEEFERPFLEETRAFYASESLDFLSNNTCPDYLRKAEARLAEEAARVASYLSASSEARLIKVAEEELVAAHAKTVVEMEGSGLGAMLHDDKLDDLRRMYSLLNRAPPALDLLREGMGRYLTQCGQSIVDGQEGAKDPVQFVRQVLALKDKVDVVIRESFRGEKRCQKRLKEAFEEFVNKDNRVASYLASFVDELLRSGGGMQGATEEVDARLEKVMVVFRFLADKDVFESYYKALLCKRLLAGRSGSDETEKLMVAKLKAECGYQFTSKLEGMFVDMGNSRLVMEEFRRTDTFAQAPIEIDVHVLTVGYWPQQSLPPCTLPPAVASCRDAFTAFYLDKHSGRKMSWVMQLGSADLKASFPSGRKELGVTTYQMCILLLFNEHQSLSLDAIRSATNISEQEMRRHLLSLCTPKLKILKKASKGKGIEDDDVFTFNEEFASKFRRIKVPLISARDVAGSGGEGAGGEALGTSGLPLSVEEDRRHLVEAAVVRTMKSRKRLSHNELIAEVTRQLAHRFPATPPFIKKRIESLIEREFLARDKDDARAYNYLA